MLKRRQKSIDFIPRSGYYQAINVLEGLLEDEWWRPKNAVRAAKAQAQAFGGRS
jgi:hypothetical protein